MKDASHLKSIVKEKYAKIAVESSPKDSQSCGCGCGGDYTNDLMMIQDEYHQVDGYVAEADLGLGCGLPTQYAQLKKKDTVIDLGSGAGNDVFIVSSIVGKEGKVIGIDMTQEMIDKSVLNNNRLGYKNVEFRLGDIENIPVENDSADIVVSNCVLNLVPDKIKAFNEIYRILKPGGHFCISDIVTKGLLPEEMRHSAELYVGCVAGAVKNEDYLKIVEESGFENVVTHSQKEINLPADMLTELLDEGQQRRLKNKEYGIYSVTLSAYKPSIN